MTQAPGPPLHPSGGEGRSLLRHELLHPEYHTGNIVGRLLGFLTRLFDRTVSHTGSLSWLTTLITMFVLVALLAGLLLLLSLLRRDPRQRRRPESLLPDDRPTAAELRRRAEEAYHQGRHEDAVVDGFRALAVRQIERGSIVDQPGATAHEVAARLAATYPQQGPVVGRTADLFDATLYGDRPVSRDEAGSVLALDDNLAGSR